jgi:ArsR family transcriptional regulator, arsenate/arsenite/antimonite-responsive transcriptional repressor
MGGDAWDFAGMFKALGHPDRLRIFEFLCSCRYPVAVETSGDVRVVNGPTVGDVCCHITGVETISSTISHHIKELRLAGLVLVERRGKNVVCAINQAALDALSAHCTALNRPGGFCAEGEGLCG